MPEMGGGDLGSRLNLPAFKFNNECFDFFSHVPFPPKPHRRSVPGDLVYVRAIKIGQLEAPRQAEIRHDLLVYHRETH
jgi:hypothetical protein